MCDIRYHPEDCPCAPPTPEQFQQMRLDAMRGIAAWYQLPREQAATPRNKETFRWWLGYLQGLRDSEQGWSHPPPEYVDA